MHTHTASRWLWCAKLYLGKKNLQLTYKNRNTLWCMCWRKFASWAALTPPSHMAIVHTPVGGQKDTVTAEVGENEQIPGRTVWTHTLLSGCCIHNIGHREGEVRRGWNFSLTDLVSLADGVSSANGGAKNTIYHTRHTSVFLQHPDGKSLCTMSMYSYYLKKNNNNQTAKIQYVIVNNHIIKINGLKLTKMSNF